MKGNMATGKNGKFAIVLFTTTYWVLFCKRCLQNILGFVNISYKKISALRFKIKLKRPLWAVDIMEGAVTSKLSIEEG